MKVCTNCQTSNEEGSKFCNSCGSTFNDICSKCGESIEGMTKFCRHCGTPIGGQVGAPAGVQPVSAQPATYGATTGCLFQWKSRER